MLLLFLSFLFEINAQEVSEVVDEVEDQLIGLDESLFAIVNRASGDDPYSEVTKYYRSPVAQLRRGVDWSVSQLLFGDVAAADIHFKEADNYHRLRLVGSTNEYTAGGDLHLSTMTRRGWNITTDLVFRSGRDANISGLFSQDFRGELSFAKRFGTDHHINILLTAPLLMEGLQGGASQEAITLTGDNLYNPAWGYYDGEVRNSRVRRYRVPELNLRYQRPIVGSTIAAITLNGESGRRSLSRLGWYDGYNPTPDYYRKLPSYVSDSDLRADIEELWRSQNSDYTQIAWDDLVEANQRSTDGEAHYIIEDQVAWVTKGDVSLLLRSDLSRGVRLAYGARFEIDQGRHYKQMNDLLGAEFLTDIDQYIGDNAHLSNDMQNNLRSSNRKIVEGDRFGYDYNLVAQSTIGVVGLECHIDKFWMELNGEFGEATIWRTGHYEKERFAGELSYGDSKKVTLPKSSAKMDLSYSPHGRHYLSLSASIFNIPPEANDLFVQEQNANRIIDNAKSQKFSSLELGYRYSAVDFMVDVRSYFIRSRNEINTWQGYDDLTYTYSDVVVSDIGFTSVGVEAVVNYCVGSDLNIEVSVAAGDYTYDTPPTISLYDDSDMTLYSTSEATAVVGCKVGNAPQLLTTIGVDYFAESSVILSADLSYAGGRYIAPSFMRRSDRVIRGGASPELEDEIVMQSNLGSVLDLTMGVTKTFWLTNFRRLSLTLRANNLLGDRDRIGYARESNRILRNSASSDTGAYYLQSHIYYYESPRTYYISCNYRF